MLLVLFILLGFIVLVLEVISVSAVIGTATTAAAAGRTAMLWGERGVAPRRCGLW